MNYHHLTIEERACIFQFKQMGMKIREIARALKRNPSTISRELKRNSYQNSSKYQPTSAQNKYKFRRKKSHRPKMITKEIKTYIEIKLRERWSPEQIAKREKDRVKGCPSFSTIYRWIHESIIIDGDMSKLRRKGKFKRPQETRGRFNIGKTIKKT
ncbi:Transposase and inactivated derivatives, IS30 family [Acholeplasma hippikon]|uniref:Transposase and inactivated derivatives, IS30 family n=1 Tax=Acholeplasma hippikon TaxID=264636 RepID=A0A449BKF7_9MOLU|nr:Transposase and inactivated derivatives, IS30 family [Acholeplasma hippikon]